MGLPASGARVKIPPSRITSRLVLGIAATQFLAQDIGDADGGVRAGCFTHRSGRDVEHLLAVERRGVGGFLLADCFPQLVHQRLLRPAMHLQVKQKELLQPKSAKA